MHYYCYTHSTSPSSSTAHTNHSHTLNHPHILPFTHRILNIQFQSKKNSMYVQLQHRALAGFKSYKITCSWKQVRSRFFIHHIKNHDQPQGYRTEH